MSDCPFNGCELDYPHTHNSTGMETKFLDEVREMAKRIKTKYNWDNVEIHYESDSEYWYMETGVGKCKVSEK